MINTNLFDFISISILLILTVIVNYFLPYTAHLGFLALLILLFSISKDNIYWIAFIFILISNPGDLFPNYSVTISLFPNLPPIELSQFFILVALLKTLNRKTYPIFYVNHLKMIFLYLLFLLLVGAIWGIGELKVHFRIVKMILPMSLFYSIPRLLFNTKVFNRFFSIIFPFVFVMLSTQLFEILKGYSIASAIGIGDIMTTQYELNRSLYGIFLLLLSLIAAIFYFNCPIGPYRKYYLLSIIGSSFFSIYMTATRGWIIGYLFLLLPFIYKNYKKISRQAMSMLIVLFILVAFMNTKLGKQGAGAIKRIGTMRSLIIDRDITANNTLSRLNVRGPKVMKRFWETPIVGRGYSLDSFKYIDAHVGNQALLLQSGIIGYSLFIIFILSFLHNIIILNKQLPYDNPYKGALIQALAFGLISIFIIHSSSAIIFSIFMPPKEGFFLAIYFSFAANCYYEATKTYQAFNPKKGYKIVLI